MRGKVKVMLIGRNFNDSIKLIKALQAVVKPIARVRAVHAGSIAAVLWACAVESTIIKAASAIPDITLEGFLRATLPIDAATRCERAGVTVLTQFGSSLFLKQCDRHIRWTSKDDVIVSVLQACTALPALVPARATAAHAKDLESLARYSTVLEPANERPFASVAVQPV